MAKSRKPEGADEGSEEDRRAIRVLYGIEYRHRMRHGIPILGKEEEVKRLVEQSYFRDKRDRAGSPSK